MKKRICFVVAVPGTARSFLKNHIAALSDDYDIYLAGNITAESEIAGLQLAGWRHIDIKRNISPLKDIKAIAQARKYFKQMRFDAVHSVTPKAGLVTAFASRLAGIKHRTHIFTGQVWATRKGLMRHLLKGIDKLIVTLDNHILVDGKSQRQYLIGQKVLKDGQAIVFGEGSISGVDITRFLPSLENRRTIRSELDIPDNKIVFVFLGRLNPDKGITELLTAFNQLATNLSNIYLLLVGSDEGNYVERFRNYPNVKNGENFCFFGRSSEPEKMLAASDIFVMPSYREGFGSSVIEAASCGLPCICSDAYGIQDAYVDNETGLKCKVGDVGSLSDCMRRLAGDRELREQLGRKGRERTANLFESSVITSHWAHFYRQILSE